MAYEIKDNSGSAFENENRREGMQDSDFSGKVKVDGKLYWVNIWKNETRSEPKRPYFGLRFSEVKPKSGGGAVGSEKKASAPSPAPAPEQDDFNDDIPF